MDLKEQLMHNEIQHLGQVIQTLSMELILIQDFLKFHLGSKYEAFRRQYGSKADQRTASTTIMPIFPITKPARSKVKSPPAKLADTDKDDDNIDLSDSDEPSTSATGALAAITENEDDNFKIDSVMTANEIYMAYQTPCSDDEAMSDSNNKSDPLSMSTSESIGRGGGRRKTKIWNFYDKVQLGNNKMSARCHICKGMVSSRAQRLVEHRIKCKLTAKGIHIKQRYKARKIAPKQKRINSDGASGTALSNHVSKIENTNNSENENEDHEPPVASALEVPSHEESKTPGGTSRVAGPGRALDLIWKYFKVVTYKNLRKARCLTCGQHVSPKVERMKKHKAICGEEVVEGEDSE